MAVSKSTCGGGTWPMKAACQSCQHMAQKPCRSRGHGNLSSAIVTGVPSHPNLNLGGGGEEGEG
jgi:hypothetical protein